MGKRFKNQLLPILVNRFRGNTSEIRRHLNEASTPAAQTLIKYIRQWDFVSRDVALVRLIECEKWSLNRKGKFEFVLDRNFEGKEYPVGRVPLLMGWERYVYGYQQTQVMPMYSFARALKNMPKKFSPDWEKEIKGLFHNINGRPVHEFKLIAISKAVASLGASNPHAVAQWDRHITDFQDAQKAINAYVVDKKGWEYLTTENLQNPVHKKELSEVLSNILAKADEIKEPAYKALEEQQRREYACSDATSARNWLKNLKGYFKRYSEPVPNALFLLESIVTDVESRALNGPTVSPVA